MARLHGCTLEENANCLNVKGGAKIVVQSSDEDVIEKLG
jgi:uncharacterized protein YlzI (FlbEa/FlbD family)